MKPDEQQEKLRQRKKEYSETFTSGSGKKVLADLETTCFVNKTTYPASNEALALAFNEGMRFVVVHIKNMMNFNLETLEKLFKEGENEDV